jgi:hypothetical protein
MIGRQARCPRGFSGGECDHRHARVQLAEVAAMLERGPQPTGGLRPIPSVDRYARQKRFHDRISFAPPRPAHDPSRSIGCSRGMSS